MEDERFLEPSLGWKIPNLKIQSCRGRQVPMPTNLHMIKEVDFIAILKYKTTEEGGRSGPAFSGYRPTMKFLFAEMQTSGQQTFISKKVVHPGETVEAEIKITSTDFFENCLEEGMNFDFGEGPQIIGTGEIIKILNEKLRK